MRIGGDVAVGAADPALPQWEQPAAASLLMTAAGRLRRPIGPSVAAAVRVRLPGPDVARDPLVLLGIGHAGRWPAQLWLSNQTDTGARHLVPLTWLSGRLEREAEELSTRTGMYDFSGRSFAGWHRHMTLASVAHLVARLGRQPERGTSEALEPVDSPLPAA